MLKMNTMFLIGLIVIAFVGCGIESDSSLSLSSSVITDPNTTDPTDPDSNTTDPDSNTTDPDSNTTDPDSNTTDPDSNTTDPDVVLPSIYDPKACGAADYYGFTDNSFYPAATFKEDYGLGITSFYPKAFTVSESEVGLFHPSVLENELDSLADVYVATNNYSFSFDRVWIQNSNRTIYIRTPLDANDEYKCYRYELNSTNASDLKAVLVHKD